MKPKFYVKQTLKIGPASGSETGWLKSKGSKLKI
jgi:hypothetical protein